MEMRSYGGVRGLIRRRGGPRVLAGRVLVAHDGVVDLQRAPDLGPKHAGYLLRSQWVAFVGDCAACLFAGQVDQR